jgi:hypothetical protein
MASKRTRTAEPETVGEEEALRSALAWSRVQELRALDEDLHKLEKALLRVNVVHQRIHAQVQQELAGATDIAIKTLSREPRLVRSFGFFFEKAIALLRGRLG